MDYDKLFSTDVFKDAEIELAFSGEASPYSICLLRRAPARDVSLTYSPLVRSEDLQPYMRVSLKIGDAYLQSGWFPIDSHIRSWWAAVRDERQRRQDEAEESSVQSAMEVFS